MGALLNEVKETVTTTTFDRAFSGSFDNPWDGSPSMVFNMFRITVKDTDESIISTQGLPQEREQFTAGKTYDIYNPITGEKIDGQTFTAEQFYAMYYSVMRRAIIDRIERENIVSYSSSSSSSSSSEDPGQPLS